MRAVTESLQALSAARWLPAFTAGWVVLALTVVCAASAGQPPNPGVPLPELESDPPGSVTPRSAAVTLRDGRVTLDLVITVAEATTLVLNGPQFGRLDAGERYPDRQFPELKFRLNDADITPRDRFEAMAGSNNITNLLRDAKMDPWAITRDPPVTTAQPRNPQILNVLRNLGAVADVNSTAKAGPVAVADPTADGTPVADAGPLDERIHWYEAKWVARRMLSFPLAAVADATLRLEYTARPGSAVLAGDDPAATVLESTYCLSATELRRLRSSSTRAPVAISEYEIATGIDGRAPAILTFSWHASQVDRQTARSLAFWCGPGGKSMSGRGSTDRQRASADASGTLRVLTLSRWAQSASWVTKTR